MSAKFSKDGGKQMIKKIFSGLIPPSYRKEPQVLITIVKWAFIGILLRFIFMPVATHSDLISIYGRAFYMMDQGQFLGMSQLLAQYFHIIFLAILKPFMSYSSEIWQWTSRLLGADERIWMNFVVHPNTYRTLFLLKLPYLLFDGLCALLLLDLFKDQKKGLRAFKFWMINPVGIFALYIFGRFEVIPVFFILLSLYYVKKRKNILAALLLGISIATKFYALLFLLPFVFVVGNKTGERVKLLFSGLVPLLIMQIANMLGGVRSEVGGLAKSLFGDYLLAMRFKLPFVHDTVFIFVVGYVLILIYVYYNSKFSFASVYKYMGVILLLLFATSFFHPHYFMWLSPFIAMQIAEDKKFIGLYTIQVLCLAVYSFQWDRALAGYLFAPISKLYFTNVMSPFTFISQFYPGEKLVGIFRSIFTAVSFWMIYQVFKSLSLRKSEIK